MLPATLLLLATTPATPPPRFDPLVVFAGRTEGAGDMRIVLHRTRHVRVHGRGVVQGDGSIVLEQEVEGAGKTPTKRTWRLRRTAPGRYTGTLSDARGAVDAEAEGDGLRLRYVTKGGFRVEQRMTLAPGGRSVRNHLVARRMGLVVARLDETIRRVD